MTNVGTELQKWRDLRSQLEAVEGMDELCIIDTLEGATDLKEMLLEIDREIQEREAFAAALSLRMKELQERKGRHDKAVDVLRTIILQAMDSAGIQKIEGAEATLSVGNLKPEIYIDDEADIPSRFFAPQPPKLDKAALRKAIEDGEAVRGARLGNGRINLSIRRK